jgi:hypothetical protein
MRFVLIGLAATVALFAQTRDVQIRTLFNQGHVFNDGVTYNISTFDYVSKNELDLISSDSTIKLGIVTTENNLIDVVWEYQNPTGVSADHLINSVQVRDINHDQLPDLIVNYNDLDGDFPDQVISAFLINHNSKFQEISETFIKNRYEILENSHLRHETPLSMFGRPYLEEDPQKNTVFWVDYYEFQGLKLVNVNQKYRSFYETFRSDSIQKINELLEQIRRYKMTDEITINQLQLEEYFNQITELKTVIYRSSKVLY